MYGEIEDDEKNDKAHLAWHTSFVSKKKKTKSKEKSKEIERERENCIGTMMTSTGPQEDVKRFATFKCLCLTRSCSRQQKKINDTVENVHTFGGAGQPVCNTTERRTDRMCFYRIVCCAHLASSFNR